MNEWLGMEWISGKDSLAWGKREIEKGGRREERENGTLIYIYVLLTLCLI